jgi:cell division protein FtsL
MQVVQTGYAIAREKQAADRLAREGQRLRVEVEALKNPARIELIAKRDLKMTPPDPARIRSCELARADPPPSVQRAHTGRSGETGPAAPAAVASAR